MLYGLKDFDEKQKETGRLSTAFLLSSICINEILTLFPSTTSITVLKELIFTKFKMHIWNSLIKYLVVVLVAQSCLTLCDPMDCSLTKLLCPWNSPGKNTGVDSHSLLQEIFLTQGSNLGLPHSRQITFWATREAPSYSQEWKICFGRSCVDWKISGSPQSMSRAANNQERD